MPCWKLLTFSKKAIKREAAIMENSYTKLDSMAMLRYFTDAELENVAFNKLGDSQRYMNQVSGHHINLRR